MPDHVPRGHGLTLALFPEPCSLPLHDGGLEVGGRHVHGRPDADGVRVQVDVLAGLGTASDLVVDPVDSKQREQSIGPSLMMLHVSIDTDTPRARFKITLSSHPR